MRFLAVAIAVVGLLAPSSPAVAASDNDQGIPGAGMIGGTPTVIVVQSPGGELGSYHGQGNGPRLRCGYYDLVGMAGNIVPAIDYATGPVNPETGKPYALLCYDENDQLVWSKLATYDPGDPLGGIAAAERAAALAADQLDLPIPEIHLSPPAGANQLVGLATWFWAANPWTPLDASATIGAVTSTATATPLRVDFDLGDGSTLTCNPGTPYDPGRPARSQSSDCTHTYLYPGRPIVTATITWDVTWHATTGAEGPLGPATRTTTVPVNVTEAQAQIR